jgi:hypothetical protein
MPNQAEDKLTKLLRVTLSSNHLGEVTAALRRMRKILEREGFTAPDISVWLPLEQPPVLTPPAPVTPTPAAPFNEDLEVSAGTTVLTFGKYKGRIFSDIWSSNPHYFKVLMAKLSEAENPTWLPPAHIMELVDYFLSRYPERVTPPHARRHP